jgi:hypothetical protein
MQTTGKHDQGTARGRKLGDRLRKALRAYAIAALYLLEEFVVGSVHERSFAQTLAEYGSRSALEVIATCLLTLLVLVPFITFQEVRRALGPGELRRVLIQRPQ